jgi:hypothetical protein
VHRLKRVDRHQSNKRHTVSKPNSKHNLHTFMHRLGRICE